MTNHVLCGAKRRNGEICKRLPSKGKKRCKFHGGASTGAPKGNQHNKKAGSLYSKFLTEEEEQLLPLLDLDKIDSELELCKIRLMRVLKKEQEQRELLDEQALELEELTESPVLLGGLPDDEGETIQVKSYKKRDYETLIDRLTARIQSLTTQRNMLVGQTIDIEIKRLQLQRLQEKQVDENFQSLTAPTFVIQPVISANAIDSTDTD